MTGWHHQLDGREFQQALGNGEGQGSLMCCGPWGYKELDTTEQLNNSNKFLHTTEYYKKENLLILKMNRF